MAKLNIVDIQNTKIVATVGPACDSYEKLLELIQNGVDVFRLNFSHGTHEGHLEVINHIVKINKEFHQHIGILADLQGPKLRIGAIANNKLEIKPGDILTFTNEECLGTMEKIYMSYERFASDVKVGERVLVDDGKIVLRVVETNGMDTVKLKVEHGTILSSKKGVNLPETKTSLPALTEKDLKDLHFILTQPVNWIALSFVRHHSDVELLREIVEQAKHPAKIMSKIEKPEAVKNLKKIIKASNGIMVARGDLGVEVPIEQLPGIQKRITKMCMQWARPVIVATQLMESMVVNPSPTRAEITDVANAIHDGADALMLSAETSVGAHPPLVIQAMNKIIAETEKVVDFARRRPEPSKKSRTFYSDVICFNAAKTAVEINAKAIIGMTTSGYTAFKVSSYRPNSDIYVFSDQMHMLGTLNLVWGVRCFYYDRFTTTDNTQNDVVEILKKYNRLKVGDMVIMTGSMPIEKRYRTNFMKIDKIE